MTKDEYNQIDNKELILCKYCNTKYHKEKFSKSKIDKNKQLGTCKYCDWLKRHKNVIPIFDGWSENEVLYMIKFILIGDSIYLNDLLVIMTNRTLHELCELFIAIGIDKKIRVKTKCTTCNKNMEIRPYLYLITEHPYCSTKCYWKDKTNQVEHGENNLYYNRISTTCTNCGKSIKIIPYNYNKLNNFGDNNNFCCQDCYWEYRSKYYRGDKHCLTGTHLSDERIQKLRLRPTKQLDRLNTKIQLIVNSILDKLEIEYQREYQMKYYSIDNYLSQYQLIIEVQGDYWHGNPLKYNDDTYFLNEKQSDGIHRDKVKHSYIKNHYNIEILYLWERDINKNPELCTELIKTYIKNNGILQNYHSFNYSFINNQLKLNDKIIMPYQDMNINEYRHIIKQKIS